MKQWKIYVPEVNGGIWCETLAPTREKALSNVRFRLFGRNAHGTTGWKVYYKEV